MAADDSRIDAALSALDNWYDDAIKSGMGFKSDSERDAYIKSLGDPEKHPMFATSTEDLEGNPLVEAIRAIKEEDKTNYELAQMYKDEGNEWMKKTDKKSVKEAVDRYTHALGFVTKALAGEDPGASLDELMLIKSQLHSNRAASHLTLQNYGSCKKDCEVAIAAWGQNIKAHYRLCRSLFLLKQYSNCMEACLIATRLDPANQDITSIYEKCQAEIVKLANTRAVQCESKWKSLKEDWRLSFDFSQMLGATLGFPVANSREPEQVVNCWPRIDTDTGGFTWPVMLLYPQYNQFDLISAAEVDLMLVEHLSAIFPELEDNEPATVPWDTHREYQGSKLVVYLHDTSGIFPARTMTAWLLACLEHYAINLSGSMDVVNYALEELNASSLGYPKAFASLQELLAFQTKRDQATSSKVEAAPIQHREVHIGCTLRRILAAEGMVHPRGVLTLLVFPRASKAHKKFLRTAQEENIAIVQLHP